MSATRTVTKVETELPCRRLPCDFAYARKHHLVNDGVVTHRVGVGGSDSDGWRVALLARDDEPWAVAISMDGASYLPIEGDGTHGSGQVGAFKGALQGVADLSSALTQAAVWLAGAALDEGLEDEVDS